MSNTLVIKFRCLCFFVRDEGTGFMHVITPATGSCHDDGPIDEHEAMLMFPKPGGRLNRRGLYKKDGEEGTTDFVPMEGWSLVLPDNGTPAVLSLLPSVVNLNDVAQTTVDPALVRGPRDARISSRITLKSGGMTEDEVPGTWTFNGQELGLARDITWTIPGLPDGPLVLRRSRFDVGQEPNPEEYETVAEIQPDAQGVFELEFHHAMKGDFGYDLKEIMPQVAVKHFLAYYCLYDAPAAQLLPEFVESPDIGTIGCIISSGTVAAA